MALAAGWVGSFAMMAFGAEKPAKPGPVEAASAAAPASDAAPAKAAGARKKKKAAGGGAKSAAAADTAKLKTAPGKVYVYKQSAGVPQELEVYFPPDWKPGQARVPGVILFHGGSWTGGTLDQFRRACEYLASRGLVAATANYRMLKKNERAELPNAAAYKRVCVTDAKSAIRWMKTHAEELGVDPARIITGGGSAGGHVSVLATTNPGLNDPADPQGVDTSVVAYLLFNPAFSGQDAADAEVDVLKHLKADLPPALFMFGTQDNWKTGTDAALARLRELGNTRVQLWLAREQSHGFFNAPPWQEVTLDRADRFLVELGLLQGEPTLKLKDGVALEKAP